MQVPTLSRRHAFKIAGLASAAAAVSRVAPARADAPATLPAALPQGAGFYRTHVGEYEITVVHDGALPLAPYPNFGANASKDAVEQCLTDDFIEPAKNMAEVVLLLVRKNGGPVTLIDAGAGKMFGPVAGFGKANLAAAGVGPQDVRRVIFTHLHGDHCGGALNDDGAIAFPNAEFYVHAAEKAFWSGPSPDLSKSGVPEEARAGFINGTHKVLNALGDRLKTFDGDTHAIEQGLTAMLTSGHTPGHCSIRFEADGDSLVHIADLMHSISIQTRHPDWYVGFDTDRDAGVARRKQVYADLAQARQRISGAHLPFPSIGHLKTVGDAYEYVPVSWMWA